MPPDQKPAPATLYYDGACPLCSREANQYRKALGASAVSFVDIAAPNFRAADHGLDPVAVQRTLHARDAEGRLHTGIDAFALVWRQLPRYRWLAKLTRTPGVRQAMQVGYAAFARVRPRLPGRRSPCGPEGCDALPKRAAAGN